MMTRFILAIVFLSSVASWAWGSFLEGQVYYCSDEIGLGYLNPGDWVHDPIISSDFNEITGSMSDPDLIREGWTEFHLWALWLALFSTSLFISTYSASMDSIYSSPIQQTISTSKISSILDCFYPRLP